MKNKMPTIKLHWAERFMNYMVHHTDLYERKTKANKNLDGISRDKRLFDQLVPFFDKLKQEAYQEGYKDGHSDGRREGIQEGHKMYHKGGPY